MSHKHTFKPPTSIGPKVSDPMMHAPQGIAGGGGLCEKKSHKKASRKKK